MLKWILIGVIAVGLAVEVVMAVPNRNSTWDRFVILEENEVEELRIVQDFLKRHEHEPTLNELDANAVLSLNRAIRIREDQIVTLKQLRTEIIGDK